MVPMITGSALNGKEFALQQFHFHWGLEPKFGSEHRIDDHIYPIEVFDVFFLLLLLKLSHINPLLFHSNTTDASCSL